MRLLVPCATHRPLNTVATTQSPEPRGPTALLAPPRQKHRAASAGTATSTSCWPGAVNWSTCKGVTSEVGALHANRVKKNSVFHRLGYSNVEMWWVRLLCHDSVSVRRKICTFGPAKNMHFWTDEKYVLLGRRKICTFGPTALVRWCVACWYVCTSAERAAKPLNANRWLPLLQESTVALTICEATRTTPTYSSAFVTLSLSCFRFISVCFENDPCGFKNPARPPHGVPEAG
jgi:hypothetical protein